MPSRSREPNGFDHGAQSASKRIRAPKQTARSDKDDSLHRDAMTRAAAPVWFPRGKEYSLNHIRVPVSIEGIFLNCGILGSLGCTERSIEPGQPTGLQFPISQSARSATSHPPYESLISNSCRQLLSSTELNGKGQILQDPSSPKP